MINSFSENDFQVVSGGLLILSALMPNAAAFAVRGRELIGRYRARTLLHRHARAAGESIQDG